MDLIALAIPFFLLALLAELVIDKFRGTGFYRANDAVNSLSAGTLSTTSGYFTGLLPAVISAWVLQHFAILEIDLALFDLSLRGLIFWMLALVAFDFCYYWAHRMGHEMSILWAAHAVHHQSEDYNLSTALRQTSTGFLFSWIFYLPLFLLGMPFEVFVTVNALDLIYQFWVHTQHIGKLGWLDRVMVTPSNHRVHHAQNEIYIDRNYGGIFILWDRLFGSFQEELDDEPVVFGVRKPLQSWNPLWANFQVYHYLWFDARHTRRWKDKIGIWFRRTGWRPDDMEARYPKRRTDISTFEKFDPPLDSRLRRYVIMHLVLSALGVLGIGALYASKGAAAVLLPCLALWMTLLSLGFLSEMKPWAARFEFTRLLLVVPACVAGTAAFGYLDADILERVTAGALVVIAASTALLGRISLLMQKDSVSSLLHKELRN
jgi:sterol desaturase/sphingolipid hydroxylase (fatty acid hydroxylase superfamily)